MVYGSLTAGFREMLDNYIIHALADWDHGYVYLFILFMAGLVGLMEKSGGLLGVTEALKGFVKTGRSAQTASFAAGCLIFFDDYANCLVAGYSMRSLADACGLSREKLAFIVDATAAPIASIIPISSWVSLISDVNVHHAYEWQLTSYLLLGYNRLALKLVSFKSSSMQSTQDTRIPPSVTRDLLYFCRLSNIDTTASLCLCSSHFSSLPV